MNTDTVLPNIGMIDDHQYMQFFSNDQNHYMPSGNCNPVVNMNQVGNNTNQTIHGYGISQPKSINMGSKVHPQSSRTSNNMDQSNMNMNYNINSAMSPLNTHNRMLNSPMTPPNTASVIDTNLNANNGNNSSNQMDYCKLSSVGMGSNHSYDTQPIARSYMQHLNSSSGGSNNELNTFQNKYHSDNSESVHICNTTTHISETDNSTQHNYTTQTMNGMNDLNHMVPSPQSYSSLVCNASNNWNQSISPQASPATMGPQCTNNKNGKPSQTTQLSFNTPHRNDNQFAYLNQHTSIRQPTSTPVSGSSQTQPINPLNNYSQQLAPIRSNNKNIHNGGGGTTATNNKSLPMISKLDSVEPFEVIDTNNISSKPIKSETVNSNFSLKDTSILAEKRSIIYLKVVEQIVDPNTKRVLKETTIKNEEICTSCGSVKFDGTLDNTSTNSNANHSRSLAGSSGHFGDISGLSTTKTISVDLSGNKMLNDESKSLDTETFELELQNKLTQKINGSIPYENDEEERAQTVSALLLLHSVTNTPVKDVDNETALLGTSTSEVSNALSSGVLLASSMEENNSQSSDFQQQQQQQTQSFPTHGQIRSGIKVMAKWKDKNFYPGEIIKQLETHKWSVKFEDSASRNLFESEIIRIENLQSGQKVMLTISGDLCVLATIKQAYIKNQKNIEFDLEIKEESKVVIKRYKLKDVFLNAEQGSTIIAKITKPILGNAVFADVDLDNIVVGKRSRTGKQTDQNDTTGATKKKTLDNWTSSDSSVIIPYKKKRKANDDSNNETGNKITIDCSKKNDMITIGQFSGSGGHHHESSLSFSPRTSKSHLSIPQNELEKILGPMPKSNSKLFVQIGFLLTSGDRSRTSTIEHELNKAERSTPFDKSYLTKQILSGGGKVYDTFEEMKSSNDNLECVLIADTYHRSIKYIQCLAAGIPIASHLWVIESCRSNKLLDRNAYILPAGFSVTTHALSSDRNTFRKSAVLFKGMKFYFGSKIADKLEKLWSPVLFAAQANIVKQDESMPNNLTRKLVDIIIGDGTCKPELIARAKQLKIPVVSSEYIVQCLINGRKLPCEASPYFSHTYDFK